MGLMDTLRNIKYQLKMQYDIGAEEGKKLKKKHKEMIFRKKEKK